MHFTTALALVAGLASFASADDVWFKEYTTSDCSDSNPTYYSSGDINGAEEMNGYSCIPVDSGSVAIRGYWNDWLSGTLMAFKSSNCSGQELGNIPRDKSDCWAVDNFMGEEQIVGSIGLNNVGM